MSHYCWPVRVYYEDTDAGGVVYYANYLKFMERARSEWLRTLGVEQDALRQQNGVLLMVHRLSVNYVKPAKFNELLQVSVEIKQIGRAKIVFAQQVSNGLGQIFCEGDVTIACVSEQHGKAMAFPVELQQILKGVSA